MRYKICQILTGGLYRVERSVHGCQDWVPLTCKSDQDYMSHRLGHSSSYELGYAKYDIAKKCLEEISAGIRDSDGNILAATLFELEIGND